MDVVLRCGQCGLPWAKISNGVLVVESRHHGDRHVNVMSIYELVEAWETSDAAPSAPTPDEGDEKEG